VQFATHTAIVLLRCSSSFSLKCMLCSWSLTCVCLLGVRIVCGLCNSVAVCMSCCFGCVQIVFKLDSCLWGWGRFLYYVETHMGRQMQQSKLRKTHSHFNIIQKAPPAPKTRIQFEHNLNTTKTTTHTHRNRVTQTTDNTNPQQTNARE
jgi:hypothetical protein